MEDNKPDYMGHRKRLKERYRNSRLNGFHDYEIIELVLTFAVPRRDVKPLAKHLIKEFKDLFGVLNASHERLVAIDGIGDNAAILLNLFKDTASIALSGQIKQREFIDSPADVVESCRIRIGGRSEEILEIICLTDNKKVIEIVTVGEGVPNKVVAFPRKVLEAAIKHKASILIMVHNHPSGDPSPSKNDLIISKKISRAADMIDIRLMDHLILGSDSYYSYAEDKIFEYSKSNL